MFEKTLLVFERQHHYVEFDYSRRKNENMVAETKKNLQDEVENSFINRFFKIVYNYIA